MLSPYGMFSTVPYSAYSVHIVTVRSNHDRFHVIAHLDSSHSRSFVSLIAHAQSPRRVDRVPLSPVRPRHERSGRSIAAMDVARQLVPPTHGALHRGGKGGRVDGSCVGGSGHDGHEGVGGGEMGDFPCAPSADAT